MKTPDEIRDAGVGDTQGTGTKLCVVLCERPEETGLLVATLEQIAAELSWQPGEQLRNYEAQAVHFAAYVDGALAGGLQLVPAALCETLPCELVWPDVRLPRREGTAHISVLAVRREFRGSAGLLWPLCVAMWRFCAAHRLSDISLEVTPETYRLYRRLGWPLEVVGDLRPHWGDDLCFLCRMGVADVAGAMLLKAPRSAAYRDIVTMMSRPCDMRSRPCEPLSPVSPPLPLSASLQPAVVSGIVVP